MVKATDGAFDARHTCGGFSIPEAKQSRGVCMEVGMCVKPPGWQVAL